MFKVGDWIKCQDNKYGIYGVGQVVDIEPERGTNNYPYTIKLVNAMSGEFITIMASGEMRHISEVEVIIAKLSGVG